MATIGRKRIDPAEKKVTLSVNLKQSTVDNMAKTGVPKKVAENIINEKFENR